MKFIRVHGRVVPLRGSGSAPTGISKRYGARREEPKQVGGGIKGIAKGALIGIGMNTAINAAFKKPLGTHAGIMAGLGMASGSISVFKHGKGMGKMQMAKLASGKEIKSKLKKYKGD
jgi:hypothetical protein